MGGLASGAWLLSPGYLKESSQAGALIEESDFELSANNSLDTIDAGVAKHWRLRRSITGKRAFDGLSFCIHQISCDDAPSNEDVRYAILCSRQSFHASVSMILK